MKTTFYSILTLLVFNAVAHATTLVGALQGYNSYSQMYYPYYNAKIELQYWNGGQWITSLYTFSGNDGYYSFYNIQPGYYYNLRINNYFNAQIFVNAPANQIQYLPVYYL